ncbi:MAG: thiamine-phosphate kinase [Candidatus Omnitrophica bacterium]|nr:thiamine-phosphate kinase [Candidatus Omnitrophota bacterium]
MYLKDIGEFGLIERFRGKIRTDRSVFMGSGDDCAVLKLDGFRYQLFTCDMIVEDIDFTEKDSMRDVGRKALGISISDIASCGGIPRHAVISLGLPKNMRLSQAELLAKGVFDLAKKFKINIVGGDISASGKIIIDVSMLGEVEKGKLCLRRGARPGDIIMVTGSFGGSIKGKHLKFIPRLKEARFLADNFKVNSMIDVSDGLIQDLGHILEQSSVGAVLYEGLIPLSREAKNTQEALCSGEEFELLFTVSREQANRIIKSSRYSFKVIGEIMPEKFGLRLIDHKSRYSKIKFSSSARTGRSGKAGDYAEVRTGRSGKAGYCAGVRAGRSDKTGYSAEARTGRSGKAGYCAGVRAGRSDKTGYSAEARTGRSFKAGYRHFQ